MPRRRLSLNRETLSPLGPAELESVAGAAPISYQNPICLVLGTTSAQHSQCYSCGLDCATPSCPPETS